MGKSSISMGHLYHGYVSHNQMVIIINPITIDMRIFLGCSFSFPYIYIYPLEKFPYVLYTLQ